MAAPSGPDLAQEPCRCGHARDQHTHLRAGRDCGVCGCPRFRTPAAQGAAGWVGSLLDRVRGGR